MANINVWSKVAVNVQSAIAATKTITAITKASPAVASSTTHGYIAGDIVLLKINGMTPLDYMVCRVLASVTADSFSLEGVDSTLYDTFTSGTAQKVTLATACSTLQDVNGSGGEAAPIVVETVHSDQNYEIPGNRSPLTYNFGSIWDPADPALIALNGFDVIKMPAVMQLTFSTGAKIFFCAFVSASLAANGSSGALVTTPVSFRLRGPIKSYGT